MVESERSYGQIHLKKVEENKKRMMDLNLNELAHSLRVPSTPLKPSSARKKQCTQVKVVTEVRRSSRITKNPTPSYKEEVGLQSLGKLTRTGQRKDTQNRVYASNEARESACERAYDLQSSLEPQLPSFVKQIDSVTRYSRILAGWRGFAIDHGLIDGDALVFEQIQPTTFKVYIIRAYDKANSDSGRIGKENVVEINKKPEHNVSEAPKL